RGLPPDAVLDAANVGVVAVNAAYEPIRAAAVERGFRQFWDDGNTRLLKRSPPPRYRFTSQYTVLAPADALRTLGESATAVATILEVPPPFAPAPDQADDPAVAADLRRNRVTLRLKAPRPGLVYCSEVDAPGWTATVNGREAPILAANYAFRAVVVPAGDVLVELRYWPPGLTAGLLLGICGLIAVAAMASRREAASGLEPSLRAPLTTATWRRLYWAGDVLVAA